MEKNAFYTTGTTGNKEFEITDFIARIGEWAAEPLRLLGAYYSGILERKLSRRQTWRLIEVQIAFLMSILPADISIAARLVLVAWLVSAACRCRKALKEEA